MPSPVPVILCGQRAQIATTVKESLLPEFEVIHIILSPAAGIAEIPAVLSGEAGSIDTSENIGTKNYSKAAAAVILGAGYEDAQVDEMRAACNKINVPWLRCDMSKPAPPLGPGYGEALVQRVKVLLSQLAEEGKMETGDIYWY